jgi:hypothetical protein
MTRDEIEDGARRLCGVIEDCIKRYEEVGSEDILIMLGMTVESVANLTEECSEGSMPATTFIANFADCLSEFAMEEEKKRMRKAQKQENNKPNYDKYK